MIRLTYTINGARFGRFFPAKDWRMAMARARILRGEGIGIEVRRFRNTRR